MFSPLTYDYLRQWRDLCEFLDNRSYKCADVEELASNLPDNQVWRPEWRQRRQQLWNTWKIQFIRWGKHPRLHFTGGRDPSGWRGWTLVSEWEFKIDFLEHLILLDSDRPQPWIPILEQRLEERLLAQAQEERATFFWVLRPDRGWTADRLHQERKRRALLTDAEKLEEDVSWINVRVQELRSEIHQKEIHRLELIQQGFCGYCKAPIIPLMMDCLKCGASYE